MKIASILNTAGLITAQNENKK